ncbi:MAG: hypothetical protein AAF541_15195 [Pseudomonadota bacterium]
MLGTSLLGGLNIARCPKALFEKYTQFNDEFWQEPSPGARNLSLGLRCIEAVHAVPDPRRQSLDIELSDTEIARISEFDFSAFTDSEQVVLQLAQKIPFNHHGISDTDVRDAQQTFGERGTVVLLVGLSFFDVNCRLKLTGGSS